MSRTTPASYRPLSKGDVKELRSLSTKKGREESGRVLIEGWKMVDEVLASSWTVDRVVVDLQRVPSHGASVLQRCVGRSVEVRSGTASDLRAISEVREDQGIVAVAVMPGRTLNDLPSAGDLLVLDGVADPGNVGTLIRSCDWFGVSAVILGPGCASVDNPKVMRSTMGSIFHVVAVHVDDLSAACQDLARRGITLVAAEVDGGTWPRWAPRGRAALVLGSESHGIDPAIRSIATHAVSIPRVGRAESLNVASAGAILLSSLAGQRHA